LSRKQNSLLLFLIFFVLFTISSKSDYRFQGTILTDYTNVTVTEAYNIVENTTTIFILDVRTQEEYSTGHLVNAKLIPYTEIISRQEELPDNKSQPLRSQITNLNPCLYIVGQGLDQFMLRTVW
jgi:hypothetical protein